MSDEQQENRDRLTRVEERFSGVEKAVQELKQLVTELGRELRASFVPLGVYDERSRRQEERLERAEARLRDLEATTAAIREKQEFLATRPAATPMWVQLLIGLVSLLGGALVTLIITLAIYYQAKP
jgi:chromosome segregation ATPase